MGTVSHLNVVEVGEDYVVEPDKILDAWKGKLKRLVLIGIDENGEAVCAGSHNPNYSLWLVEKAKKDILV